LTQLTLSLSFLSRQLGHLIKKRNEKALI